MITHERFNLRLELGQFEGRLARFCRKRDGVRVSPGADEPYLEIWSLDIGAVIGLRLGAFSS